MKKTILFVFSALFFITTNSQAQFTRYIVKLTDKGYNPFSINNPIQFLTQRSIDRRNRYNIAIDSTDLPVTARYIDSIKNAGAVTILNTSKWLNQVAIQTSDAAALVKINSFPFVMATSPIGSFANTSNKPVNKKLDAEITGNTAPLSTSNLITADYYNYGLSYAQVHLHNGEFLHNRGFRGQGMQMAVLDAGFYHYLTLPTFDSIRNNGQVLGTWDFVARNESVNEDHTHGMNCLSTIAANMPGTFMGTAPKTSFYLFRTEDVSSEYPIEEQNWVAGMEKADSLGVEITSTSLGYYNFDNPALNYTYANLDGNTTLSARGADMAAKKGMLCVIAAGNEGNNAWHYIITPSDADSVMAVGAVNTSGVVGSFSSYGPSSDGQIKPSVAAVGVGSVIANPSTGQPTYGNGTSFATPIMAGLTTCLWQAFPEINNMGIINVLQQSATRASNPDNRVGYGIPDMKKAFVMLIKQLYSQQAVVANCNVTFQLNAKTDSAITIDVQRKLPGEIIYNTINTISSTGGFKMNNLIFVDDLSMYTTSGISYRFKMNIAADTSFYLDSTIVNFIPKPNLGTDKSISICSGNSLNLTTQFVTTGLNINWTINGTNVANPLAVNMPGIYQLIATNASGCADTVTLTLTINTKPNLGNDLLFTKCTDSTLNLLTLFNTTNLITNWTIGGITVTNPAAVLSEGVYRLIAENNFGCADTALVTISNDNGICIAALKEEVIISPNPVSDNLTILVARKNAVKVDITIHNSIGQMVLKQTYQQSPGQANYSIPFKKWSGGVYFVTIRLNDEKVLVKKVVKQ
ncbi:MAG: S8 family serine peptidase [Ferruginibacter sp.]|nr:S8 family serine peptidase [Ferruginibacter sp.]